MNHSEYEYVKATERKRNKFGVAMDVIIVAVIVVIVQVIMFLGGDQAPHAVSVDDVPPFSEYVYAVINDNEPLFAVEEMVVSDLEFYSELDYLGRCGYAIACLGKETMPTEERESISSVKPSGWVQAQYDFVDGGMLYNRCHLIGFQLAGENANEKNLITGTRFLNVRGMLPYENMVADYIRETGNHVLYRVTPIYKGSELVARGVQLEGWSIEDYGEGIRFHVYLYNEQPGVVIDFATGESRLQD